MCVYVYITHLVYFILVVALLREGLIGVAQ